MRQAELCGECGGEEGEGCLPAGAAEDGVGGDGGVVGGEVDGFGGKGVDVGFIDLDVGGNRVVEVWTVEETASTVLPEKTDV